MDNLSVIDQCFVEEHREGLLARSLKEVEEILRRYGTSGTRTGDASHESHLSPSGRDRSDNHWRKVFDVSDVQSQIVEQRIAQLVADLQSTGRGSISGDYDVSQTAFFKVAADAEKVDDGYALHFSVAGGLNLDQQISTSFIIPLYLRRMNVTAVLSTPSSSQFIYEFRSALHTLTEAFSRPVTILPSEQEFRGSFNHIAFYQDHYYLVDIFFSGTPACIYNKGYVQGFVGRKIDGMLAQPALELHICPAEVYETKDLMGNTGLDLRKKYGIHVEEDCQRLRDFAGYVSTKLK